MLKKTIGIKLDETLPPKADCEICRTSTATRIISRKEREKSFPIMPFACISVNLFDIGLAYNHDRVMALFTCRYSGYRLGIILPFKSDFPEALQTYIAQIKRSYRIEVRMILMDNKTSFTQRDKEAIATEGINLIPHSAYHPHHRGHQERSGGVTKELATHLRQQAGIPPEFWNTAYNTAIYLLNRRPRRLREWQSPLKMINLWLRKHRPKWSHLEADQRPNVHHVRAYSYKAYMLTKDRLKGLTTKLDTRAHIRYLVGIISSTQYLV